MPLSRYLKIYPCRDRPGSSLLYSTKKGALIRLSLAQMEALKREALTDVERATLTRLEIWTDNPDAERESMAAIVSRVNRRRDKFKVIVVLNLDCNLYKCPAFLGWPELSAGSLTDGIGDYSVSHNLDFWKTDECLECAYLPLCFGGCWLLPLLEHGSINRVDCRKEFYDSVLESFILQDLRYR